MDYEYWDEDKVQQEDFELFVEAMERYAREQEEENKEAVFKYDEGGEG